MTAPRVQGGSSWALFALALEHDDYRSLLECLFQGCAGVIALVHNWRRGRIMIRKGPAILMATAELRWSHVIIYLSERTCAFHPADILSAISKESCAKMLYIMCLTELNEYHNNREASRSACIQYNVRLTLDTWPQLALQPQQREGIHRARVAVLSIFPIT